MKQLDHQINLDRANGAEDNASKGEEKMSHSSKKTPWFLRFAPGAILRKKAIIAIIAGVAVLTPVQTYASWKLIVETVTSWAIGKALDAATEALLRANGGITITDNSPRANAIVNGADWLSNEWTYKYEVQPIVDGPWETQTATASMGHQQERKTARGTRLDGTAMRQTEAFNKFSHARYSKRWVKFEIFDDDGYYDDVFASARTDYIRRYVNREFRKLRKFYKDNEESPGPGWPNGTITLGPIWEIGTTTYNVGDYEAVSNFQNPSGNTALGKADAEDEEADKYKGTIYWHYSWIYPSGNWSSRVEGWHDFDFITIKTKHAESSAVCKNNQIIRYGPKISAGAQRFFEDKENQIWRYTFLGNDPNGRPQYSRTLDEVRKERVVSQTESDEHKKPN